MKESPFGDQMFATAWASVCETRALATVGSGECLERAKP